MTHYGPIEKLREAAEGEAYLVREATLPQL